MALASSSGEESNGSTSSPASLTAAVSLILRVASALPVRDSPLPQVSAAD